MALKKGLVVYPRGEGDAEKYFAILARKFKRAHRDIDITLEDFGDGDAEDFKADLSKPAYTGIDVFAYIGHGMSTYLLSANGDTDDARKTLADRLKAICNDNAVILILACNCGDLGDSLLGYLYGKTLGRNFTFYGHTSSWKAANNPDKSIFPPAKGEDLSVRILGDLAKSKRFKDAWWASFDNESDSFWATFFLLDNAKMLRRACKPALRAAAVANERHMREVGWSGEVDAIRRFLGVVDKSGEELALAIANWQAINVKPEDADGILGRVTWAKMKPMLNAPPESRARQPGETRYGPNP